MKIINLNIAAIAILLLLGAIYQGCAVGPKYKGVEIESNDNYRFDSLRVDTTAELKWWEIFQDSLLDSLVRVALLENKDVLIAASRIEEARLIVGVRKSDYAPKFDLSANVVGGNYIGSKFDKTTSGFSAGMTMNWELDIWGKYRRYTESAKADLLASEYNVRKIQQSLIAEVISNYFLLLDFRWRHEIAIQTLQSREKSLEIIQARFDKGVIPEIDLNQAQIQYAIAKASVPFYYRQVAFVENALMVLLGRNPGIIPESGSLKRQAVPQPFPPGLPSDLLQLRPDIAESEQNVISQNALVGVAVAERFPSISITGLLGVASNDLKTFNNGGFAWNAGGSLLGPLFYFGRNKKKVKIEKQRLEQAILEYEKVVLIAFREVEDALVSIETYQEEVEAAEFRSIAAVKAEFLAQKRYDGGVTSYLEVLETQRLSFEAQLEYSRIYQEYLNSYMDLYKALGGGWITAEEEEAQD